MSTTAVSPIRLFQAAHSPGLEQAALDVLRSGQIASGPKVPEFEKALGELIGRPHVVTTNDMTSALVLALHLAGVGANDEVLTLAYSCLSSNSAIVRVGAKAVWVDIDAATATMSVDDCRAAITQRTKAVMVYHVAGYPGPTREIAELCRERGIAVIEDCNNAFGAVVNGAPIGSIGDYAVYSFYPNRQINAIEGGALACPDEATAQRAMRLRRFGIDAPHFRDALGEISATSDIPEVGWSAAFSQLNAAVGLSQMSALPVQRASTLKNAARLHAALEDLRGIRPIQTLPDVEPAYWGLLVLAEQRDALLSSLKDRGIHTSRLHHRNDDYTGFAATRRNLPGTDAIMAQVLAIPCGWWLADEDVQRLTATLRELCGP